MQTLFPFGSVTQCPIHTIVRSPPPVTPESRRVPQRPPFTDYRQSRKLS